MHGKANIRQVGDVAIVDLSGRVTLGDGSGIVRETWSRNPYSLKRRKISNRLTAGLTLR
jgi:hypothetical protein